MLKKKLALVDTNVLVRYLVGDHPAHLRQATLFLDAARPKSVQLSDSVFLEVGYVLLSLYQVPRDKLVETLSVLIAHPAFQLDYSGLHQTLEIFRQTNLSLLDSNLAAQFVLGRVSKIETFDKKLAQYC